MTPERSVAEIDELLRSVPSADDLQSSDNPEALAWKGRFAAVCTAVGGIVAGGAAQAAITMARTTYGAETGKHDALALLHQLRYSALLQGNLPTSAVVSAGAPFEYFDEVRKLVATAAKDLLFVDPYLDPDFVGRYLPHVPPTVRVRLLGSNKASALASSVKAYQQQTGLAVEVRKSSAIHDRFIFIDAARCYQSGASFKDGAAKSPTIISQIVDAFDAMRATYEALWAASLPVTGGQGVS